MKRFRSIVLALSFLSFLMITSCSKQELTHEQPLSELTANLPSFDQTALKLSEILLLAKENNWFEHNDLIIRLMKPGKSLTLAEKEELSSALGITYDEFNRLILELGYEVNQYTRALRQLNLSKEDQTRVIHDAIVSSEPLNQLRTIGINERGNCFFQDACNFIGGIFIDIYLALFCNTFCPEEALPLIIMVGEFCEIFAC